MHRTQLYLPQEEYHLIKVLADQQGTSQAVILRQAISSGLKKIISVTQKKSAFFALKELSKIQASGPKDLGENMTQYLYGKNSEYGQK